MIVRYIPADPAGNLTAIVLSPVAPQARAAVAARMMARCPEDFEQVGFAEEDSLTGEFPRLCMMGGEFCGNAARAFACYAAGVRGRGETRLSVAISGARNPVPVEIEPASGRAYAQMPLPCALDRLCADGRDIPLVRMDGIDHALLLNEAPSPELAERVLAAMPGQDAQGVLARVGEQLRLGHGRAGVVSGAALCGRHARLRLRRTRRSAGGPRRHGGRARRARRNGRGGQAGRREENRTVKVK